MSGQYTPPSIELQDHEGVRYVSALLISPLQIGAHMPRYKSSRYIPARYRSPRRSANFCATPDSAGNLSFGYVKPSFGIFQDNSVCTIRWRSAACRIVAGGHLVRYSSSPRTSGSHLAFKESISVRKPAIRTKSCSAFKLHSSTGEMKQSLRQQPFLKSLCSLILQGPLHTTKRIPIPRSTEIKRLVRPFLPQVRHTLRYKVLGTIVEESGVHRFCGSCDDGNKSLFVILHHL